MILRPHIAFLAASLLLFVANSSASIPDRPVIDKRARVKQHRSGARGDLVPGEEALRKIIVSWPRSPGALEYEICHNCNVDDATGVRLDNPDNNNGVVRKINIEDTCAGNPCAIFPGAPMGKNRFNVRVQTSEGWSLWSEHANFLVEQPGIIQHEHDEL